MVSWGKFYISLFARQNGRIKTVFMVFWAPQGILSTTSLRKIWDTRSQSQGEAVYCKWQLKPGMGTCRSEHKLYIKRKLDRNRGSSPDGAGCNEHFLAKESEWKNQHSMAASQFFFFCQESMESESTHLE